MTTLGFAAETRARPKIPALLRAILDGVDMGIITTGADGCVVLVNRSARAILRRDQGLEGADVRELLNLRASPEILAGRPKDRRPPATIVVGDEEIEIDLAVSRIELGADEAERTPNANGFTFVFHDRTYEKRLEQERRRFEHLAAMGTMVAGFAHEIRNPMASLRSLAESMREELADAKLSLPHLDRMLAVIGRVERLVRTSLLFGRPSPPRPAAHRPSTLLSAAVSALLPRTRELGGELHVDVDPTLPDVFVDDGQIVQVLVIFLNNALDATGSPRRVGLRAQHERPGAEMRGEGRARKSDPPSPFIRIDVRDDGRGIPPDIVGRIFDPFFTTKATGTGLGLSIAQQLVTENGGRIQLTSAVGGPTNFTMLIPIATAEMPPISRR